MRQFGDVVARVQKFRPAYTLFYDSQGVIARFSCLAKRLDGGMKQPHEAFNLLRRRGVASLFRVLGARKSIADEFVSHLDHGVGQLLFEINDERDENRTPTMRGIAVEKIGQ